MDDAFYNAVALASSEICDCEHPSECMSIVIERFTDYKGFKDFRDEVIKQVLECQEAKKVRAEYEAHFDEAVKAVADELCKKGNPAKNFYETTAGLYPDYDYQEDTHFRQEDIKRAQSCIDKRSFRPRSNTTGEILLLRYQ